MNWNDIITQIIVGIVGMVISGLGVFITYLINKWIKNQEVKDMFSSLNDVVRNAVLETYQTYVEELKDKDMFDSEAQKLALEHAKQLIKVNLPEKVQTWLKTNFKDIQAYIESLIEAQIGLLKNSGR